MPSASGRLGVGWHWLGRLRGWTRVKPWAEEDAPNQWVDCRELHALATRTPRELPLMQTNRSDPITCRLVVYAKVAKGRKHRTRLGGVARNSNSRKAAVREREPWLLVCSPELSVPSARQLVGLYTRRMQIESSFRDLKSHRYGQGFEDNLTRSGARLQILLLVGTLASFASWLAGLGCEATGIAHWLLPARPSASSTRPCALAARHWSDAGRWNPFPNGWIVCDHCRRPRLIRWSCRHENVGIPQPLTPFECDPV